MTSPGIRRRLTSVASVASLAFVASVAWLLTPVELERPPSLGTTIEDRAGLPLRVTRASDGSRSEWIALEDMDPDLIQAFIAQEDRRFFQHHGVDPLAIARAARDAVRRRRIVSGASTITMQLARIERAPGHGLLPKLRQMLWAWRIEAHHGKQRILEHYLNRVPLGQGAVGVSAASRLYFGTAAAHLSLGQAATIAGLAAFPNAPDRARGRATALRRMQRLGFADSASITVALAEPLPQAIRATPFRAPHFTTRVLALAGDDSAGAALRTSIDLALQAELEAEVRHTVDVLRESEVRDGAAVVLDNATGQVLAWVGSPDFWSDTAGQVDMVTSPRQPGSALKPFLYALAIDRGYTAASVLPDEPRTYRTATGPYQPRNYDRRFHGPTLVREALASSFNVPAVELTHRLGAATLLRVLRDAGFTSLDAGADRYGLGLSLGNGDVTLLELANAYRGLANGGVHTPVSAGAALVAAPSGPARRFASPGAAYLVLDILADPVARIPGFGDHTPFDFPFPVAVKTGTSHHFTDNWAVGVTGRFTVAVWVGNFSGRPMRRISGVTGAGPLLHRAVLAVSRRYEPGVLPSPAAAGAARVRACRLTGELAGASCPGTDEWFLPSTTPATTCTAHATDRVIARSADRLEITSPRHGDLYQVPPGVDTRYATVPLRARGAAGEVRWLVNGRDYPSDRLVLSSGSMTIEAVTASGQHAQVTVQVRQED